MELVVVLVIVAILAAVAVPVFLGFTDDAKEKQYIAEAQEALAAAQTMMSDAYADNLQYLPQRVREEAFKTSGLANGTELTIYTAEEYKTKADGTSKTLAAYTIVNALYKTEDGHYLYYENNQWKLIDSTDGHVTNKKAGNYIAVWPEADMGDSAGPGYKASEDNPEAELPVLIEDPETKIDENNDDVQEEEPDLPNDQPDKLIVKFKTADGVTYGNDDEPFETEYIQGKGLSPAPNPIIDGWYYDENTLTWDISGVSTQDEITTINGIETQLSSIVSSQNGQTITIEPNIDEQKIDINVSFVACDAQTQKVSVNDESALDRVTDPDGLKDTVVLKYGMVSEAIVDADPRFLEERVTVTPNCEEANAIVFDQKWAVKRDNEYLKDNENEYLLAEGTQQVFDTIAEWAENNIVENDSASLYTVQSGISFVAPAKINKKAYIRGTVNDSGDLTRKVGFKDKSTTNVVYSFDAEFKKEELTGEISELTSTGEKEVVFAEDGTTNYSIFDERNLSIEYTGTISFWKFYSCNRDETGISDNSFYRTREVDCSQDVINQLFSSYNFGELVEIDVTDLTTKFIANTSFELRNKFSGLVNGSNKVKRIVFIAGGNAPDLSTVDKEVCLSVTPVVGSGSYLERDEVTGKYKVNDKDRDEEYPAYTVAYTKKNEEGVIYVITEDGTDIKAVGSLANFNSGFSEMVTNEVIEHVDTVDVTDMSSMFADCNKLTTLIDMDVRSATSFENMFNNAAKLTTVKLDAGKESKGYAAQLASVSGMFAGAAELQTVELKNINSERLNSVNSLFSGLTNLTTVDLSGFHTEAINDFGRLFEGCTGIENITGPVTGETHTSNTSAIEIYMDIPKATNLAGMFKDASCFNGVYLDAGSVDQASGLVANGLNEIFAGASELQTVGLKNINSTELNSVNSLFSGLTNLSNVDLSGFHTERINDFGQMFEGCSGIETITGPHTSEEHTADTSAIEIYMDIPMAKNLTSMFEGASSFTRIYLDAKNEAGTAGANELDNDSLSNIFKEATALQHVALKNIDAENLKSLNSLFSGKESLADVDLSGFNTRRITDFHAMFKGCKDLTGVLTDETEEGEDGFAATLRIDAATDIGNMFFECRSLTGVSLSGNGTETDTGLSIINNLFSGCDGLSKAEIKNIYSTALLSINGLFRDKANLKSVDLSGFIIPNAAEMQYTFAGCTTLSSINFGTFDTSGATNMSYMFQACKAITTLDLRSFNTKEVTTMAYMFDRCITLSNIDVTSFETSKVTTMEGMFGNSLEKEEETWNETWNNALEELDLSTFRTKVLSSIKNMFLHCSALKKIYVNPLQWETTKFSYVVDGPGDSTFLGCSSLVGEAGTSTLAMVAAADGNINIASEEVSAVYAFADEKDDEDLNWNESKHENGYFTARRVRTQFVEMSCNKYGEKQNNKNKGKNWPNDIFKGSYNLFKMTKFARWTEPEFDPSEHTNVQEISVKTYRDPETNRYYPIYGWFGDNDVFYWWSEAQIAELNPETEGMFNYYYNVQTVAQSATKLTEIDFQGIDTSQVKSFFRFFSDCKSLTRIYDGSKGDGTVKIDYTFKSDQATDMFGMFGSCVLLESVDLTQCDTSKVTDMADMFMDVATVQELDLRSFSSASLTRCGCMFMMRTSNDNKRDFYRNGVKCQPGTHSLLSSIIFGENFTCESVTGNAENGNYNGGKQGFYEMFYQCVGLQSLDLRYFNVAKKTGDNSKVTAKEMFCGCKNLTTIYVTDPDDEDLGHKGFFYKSGTNTRISGTGDMFKNCNSLEGGNGSTFVNLNKKTDGTYALVDKDNQKGYFTDFHQKPTTTTTTGN